MRTVHLTSLLFLSLYCLSSSHAFAQTLTFLKHNSKPKYLDDNTGLCDQIYQALITQLGPTDIEIIVDPAFYPIKRILQMLKTDEADGFCGIQKTDQREEYFTYVEPSIYTVSFVLMAHKSENFLPTSVDQIIQQNSIVGAFYGTSSAKWLSSHTGVTVNDRLDSLDTAVNLVDMQKLRYFYYHDLALNYYAQDSELAVKVLPTPLQASRHWLILNKKLSPHTKELIQTALIALTDSGRLTAIQSHYLIK